MTEKISLFAFNGDPMCFIHVLLNTIDLNEKGYEVKLVIEGSATKLIDMLDKEEHPMNHLYKEVIEKGLLDCVCKACANKMGTLEHAKDTGLPLCSELSGHPSISGYIDQGYKVIVF